MTLEEYLQDAKESYENHLDENHIPVLIEIIETMREALEGSVQKKFYGCNCCDGGRQHYEMALEALQKCEEIVSEK